MNADKEKLSILGERSITKVFKDCLALIELSGLDKEQFKKVRKQILRSGNDEIRKFKEELEKYEVKYTPTYNERIDFGEDSRD
ncbi:MULTISPECIES: hypothetical protein [Paenibacillus]|uniref:hypothetical protein n=1 Tax=Paenibacillus TaxID=44249 RepID=UPI000F51BDB5|nr:hypothetical protein [Paenibacillus xylanexedens]RPK20065.1 hypothetical protein EDO6_06582 [Paenibacillus xylanexedens]